MTGAIALLQLLFIGRSPAMPIARLRPVWNSARDSGAFGRKDLYFCAFSAQDDVVG